MKNRYFYSIVILLLLLPSIILLSKTDDKKSEAVEENNGSVTQDFYQDKFLEEKQNENRKIDKNLLLITLEGDTVRTKDIWSKGQLVFRYSSLNCRACVNAEYDQLIELSELMERSNRPISIVAFQDNLRDLYVDHKWAQKEGLTGVDFYLLLEDQLNIPMDKNNEPYYFQLTPDLTITNFFVPEKSMPQLSEAYLKSALSNSSKAIAEN